MYVLASVRNNTEGDKFHVIKETIVKISHQVKVAIGCLLFGGILTGYARAYDRCGVAVSSPAYPEGLMGIDAGSTPPPGTVVLLVSGGEAVENHMRNSCGDEVVGWKATIVPIMTILNWQTGKKFLGGQYGFSFVEASMADINITVPTGSNTTETGNVAGPLDPSIFPLTLAWRQKRFEETVQVGEQLSINSFNKNSLVNRAMGYYSTLLSFGGTAALSKDHTARFSVLNHMEFHHEHMVGLHYTLGAEDHFDAGLSKDFNQGPILSKYLYPFTVGAVGWGHFMFTESHGSDLPWDSHIRPHAWAYGAEVHKGYPKQGIDLGFIWTRSNASMSFPLENCYMFKMAKVLRPPFMHR
jgi:hypothetical protein